MSTLLREIRCAWCGVHSPARRQRLTWESGDWRCSDAFGARPYERRKTGQRHRGWPRSAVASVANSTSCRFCDACLRAPDAKMRASSRWWNTTTWGRWVAAWIKSGHAPTPRANEEASIILSNFMITRQILNRIKAVSANASLPKPPMSPLFLVLGQNLSRGQINA